MGALCAGLLAAASHLSDPTRIAGSCGLGTHNKSRSGSGCCCCCTNAAPRGHCVRALRRVRVRCKVRCGVKWMKDARCVGRGGIWATAAAGDLGPGKGESGWWGCLRVGLCSPLSPGKAKWVQSTEQALASFHQPCASIPITATGIDPIGNCSFHQRPLPCKGPSQTHHTVCMNMDVTNPQLISFLSVSGTNERALSPTSRTLGRRSHQPRGHLPSDNLTPKRPDKSYLRC